MYRSSPQHNHIGLNGFTLIEIMVVMIIMLLIASFLIIGLDRVEDSRNTLLTTQRIENILNTMARTGMDGSGSVTFELQDAIPDFGGTRRFERGIGVTSNPYVLPEDADGNGSPDDWHAVFPDSAAVAPDNPIVSASGSGAPLIMPYPWGTQRRYRIGDWNDSSDSDYYYYSRYESQVESDSTYAYPAPERHVIQELWPNFTPQIMVFLDIVSDEATYENNRNPKQGWNDAWGNPLVIAYAIYQPPRYNGTDTRRYPDSYLSIAKQEYQYNRSIFVSVGAPGPEISPYTLVDDWTVNMIAMWNHICEVAMPTSELVWDETSFSTNPWSGIHQNTDEEGLRTTYISAPVEFK